MLDKRFDLVEIQHRFRHCAQKSNISSLICRNGARPQAFRMAEKVTLKPYEAVFLSIDEVFPSLYLLGQHQAFVAAKSRNQRSALVREYSLGVDLQEVRIRY